LIDKYHIGHLLNLFLKRFFEAISILFVVSAPPQAAG
jgi:hypothetical protein